MRRFAVLLALVAILVVSGCSTGGSVQGRGSENGGGGRAKVNWPF